MTRFFVVLLPAGLHLVGRPAWAQGDAPVELVTSRTPLTISVDDDDDDEDGAQDGNAARPSDADDEAVEIVVRGPPVPATDMIRLGGRGLERVRLFDADHALSLPAAIPASRLPVTLKVVGRRASAAHEDVLLTAERQGAGGPVAPAAQVALTVVAIRFVGASNEVLDPSRASLQVSNEITDGPSLPRGDAFDLTSEDPDNFRIEVADPTPGAASLELVSTDARTGAVRDRIAAVGLAHGPHGGAQRTAFIRLVADDMDRSAPGVQGQVLRVALRDRVRVVYRDATMDMRVGRPGREDGAQAARRARFDIVVVRLSAGGPPSVGVDDADATRVARRQVEIANEIYAQCNIAWGDPADTRVRIVDPPQATLLAVGDSDGLPALGGVIRFRVGGRPIRPLATRPGWSPIETATALGERIRALGYGAEVTHNVRTDQGAGASADVLARGAGGEALRFEADGEAPLTTDSRQRVEIGSVDLTDQLDDFDNMNASSGTLEERTLIKTLTDGDPATIDLYVVNRFSSGARQGEAFIEGDAGPILNAVVLDRSGIRQERQSWTQSHEAGHVLLDQPYHPDNVGPDRPWLLMDADASLGAVSGPKRLGEDECARMLSESGPPGSLLRRYDAGVP
ncbi:MAG: hypothetical protein HYY06_02570 [Deltaproteobacteria bacterium]|nr:hypothetical protein [Deltaproteobacteria bacterium]